MLKNEELTEVLIKFMGIVDKLQDEVLRLVIEVKELKEISCKSRLPQ